jgi:plastocyanin
MYLRPLEGNDLRMRIAKRKSAPMLEAVPAQELEKAYAPPSPAHVEALTGFIAPAPKPGESQPAPAQEAAAPETEAPAPAENPEGTLSVTTFPYLAEIFVDGKSVGYSPAKVSVSAGKHTVRFEKQGYKSWSKDVTVQENSETVVDATLDKQKK